ncbi:hypothetical protein JZ751_012931, partial [Albula glossodonta]
TLLLLTHLYCVSLAGSRSSPVAGAVIGVLFIILLGAVICMYMRKRRKTPGRQGEVDEVVYSSVDHKPPKKQKAAAPTVTQGESSCVYAEVRRK